MRVGRVEISSGAILALALLYYLDESGVAVWVLLAGIAHEMGHWVAIRALGGRISLLRISCAGAELCLSAARPLPPGRMVAAALAGPGVNLGLAWVSAMLARSGSGRGLYFFAGLNLGLACFNLLPAKWLDGGRALQNIFAKMGRKEEGERVIELCSDVVAALLLGAGVVLLWQSQGQNFTAFIAGLWMMAGARAERRAASI